MSKFGSAVKTWATYNPSALTPWWSWLNARASHILMLAVLFLILAAHAPTDIVNIERSPAHQIIPGFDHAMCIAWLGPTFILR